MANEYAKRIAETRFLKYVSKSKTCWIWIGGSGTTGYGRFWNGSKLVLPHRFSYELFKGPIPIGLQVDHLCRVRCCVNPYHLRLLTNRDNVLAGVGVTAINYKKTHCVRGHLLSGANLYIQHRDGRPRRLCRSCRRNARLRYERAKREE